MAERLNGQMCNVRCAVHKSSDRYLCKSISRPSILLSAFCSCSHHPPLLFIEALRLVLLVTCFFHKCFFLFVHGQILIINKAIQERMQTASALFSGYFCLLFMYLSTNLFLLTLFSKKTMYFFAHSFGRISLSFASFQQFRVCYNVFFC